MISSVRIVHLMFEQALPKIGKLIYRGSRIHLDTLRRICCHHLICEEKLIVKMRLN